ncbi:hypothetical protein BV898_08518 [Hypsibius exemplaris]|uniref:DUF659 domain-containing protein n=1 Tax=Hypsibius exemplaris TaxID=2072580 RepID=A0A1W0WQD9_HYPEX|nr:hypothetical protein BV898_08518 [Hypsibius exemplaris]
MADSESDLDEDEREVRYGPDGGGAPVHRAPHQSKSKGPFNPLWKFFRRSTEKVPNTRHFTAFCLACSAKSPTPNQWIRGEPDYLRRHLSNCKYLNASQLSEFRKLEQQMDREKAEKKRKLEPVQSEVNDCVKKPVNLPLAPFMDRPLDSTQQLTFNRLLLDGFISAGIPFSAVENPHIRSALRFLRPAIKLPCRQTFGGPLLDARIAEVKEVMHDAIKNAPFLNLSTDAWKDISRRKILGFVVTGPCGSGLVENFLYSSDDVTSERYTGEDAVKKIMAVIVDIRTKHGGDVRCVTMDSDGAHIRARHLLEIQHPEILSLPCFAHQVNLMFKRVFEKVHFFKSTCASALKIISYFGQNGRNQAILHAEQKRLLKKTISFSQPTETRWYSTANCMKSVFESRLALQTLDLLPATDKPAERILEVVRSGVFWLNLESVLNILGPMVKAQASLETDGATLYDVVVSVREINRTFSVSVSLDALVKAQLVETLEWRWKKFFNPKVLVLGCVFNPHVRLSLFSPFSVKWQPHVFDWAEEYYKRLFRAEPESLFPSLLKYRDQVKPFDEGTLRKWKNPVDFWSYVQFDHPELSKLAGFFLKISIHAAAIERVWSFMTGVQTKARNRLSHTKVHGTAAVKMDLIKRLEKERTEQRKMAERREAASKATLNLPGPSFPTILMDSDEEIEILEQPEAAMETDGGGKVEQMIEELEALEEEDVDLLNWLEEQAVARPVDTFFTVAELFANSLAQ